MHIKGVRENSSLTSLICCLSGLLVVANELAATGKQIQFAEARKHHHSRSLAKCHDKECDMSAQHFALYSTVKRALDSEFNLSGKEIVPMLRSVEILKKRFLSDSQPTAAGAASRLNGTDLVQALLNNGTLVEALKVFNSDAGRELITFYRASVNGRAQNLACSQMRIEDLKRVTARVESSWEFHNAFTKINKNYLKKSAKKCLKNSCSSVELAMTKLDSVLLGGGSGSSKQLLQSERNKHALPANSNHFADDNSIQTDGPVAVSSTLVDQQAGQEFVGGEKAPREFHLEELELCKFLMRTNETECKISGTEMADLFVEPEQMTTTTTTATTASVTDGSPKSNSLVEYLNIYAANNMPGAPGSPEEAGKRVLSHCRSMSALMEYNLSPLKWYRERGLIDDQKLASRAFWCKGLSYWIQMDRLCGELASRLQQQMRLFNNDQVTTTAPTTKTTNAAATAAATTSSSSK